ncbi:hypothetical protein M0805_006348 [Coniferiporia weirii]|nr:hypothetical protein M0805_006348 [Coniferiporia weirii]
MPKRTKSPEEDVSASESEPEAETTPPPKRAKKTSQKKAVSKPKPAKPDESSSSAAKSKKGDVGKNFLAEWYHDPHFMGKFYLSFSIAFTNTEGGKFVDLGRKRRATVRTFKGQVMIDIREFYGDDDDLKPGKKGISLSPEQWEELKSNMSSIDGFIKNLQ